MSQAEETAPKVADEEEAAPSEDEGLAKLSPEARMFLHLRDLHKAPQGLPPHAWTLADQYTGCPVSQAGPEFQAWMDGPDGERYIEALHKASHDIGGQTHAEDLI